MDFSIILTSALRTQGHKITKNRTAILEYLSGQVTPISADEILEHISSEHQTVNSRVLLSPSSTISRTPNKTTIYRELFFLLENNFIEEIEFGDGKKRYEIAINRPHHHHIICVNCKQVVDIPLENDFEVQKKRIEQTTRFKLTSHMLEFFGLCPACNAIA